VEEIQINAVAPTEMIRLVVAAGRQAGRRVRIVGTASLKDLPPIASGERWTREEPKADPSWLLRLREPPAWQRGIKRIADVVLSAGMLIGLSPVLLGIAIGVRLSSPGPILYRWEVVGRNGRPFTGYKFRTMVPEADNLKPALCAANEMVGPVFKLTNDPRVTHFGRWLRRFSLDEFPQLWNVLKGDMSLVGPRPPLREEYPHFELWQMRKLSATPGLTCLWQINGRNAIRDFADWVRLDLQYIDQWSLRLDASILARTIPAVFKGTGL
jgi:lipopolysaccharide/colanic/teichoic acid biosynthesis glycosyltransferase